MAIHIPQTPNRTVFGSPDPGSLALPDGITTNAFMLMREAGELLNRHYPGHLWLIDVPKGGVLVIRHGLIGARHGWGYVLHLSDFNTWDQLRDRVKTAGGELLERANLRRGPMKDGDSLPTHIDGLPDKHQPVRPSMIYWTED